MKENNKLRVAIVGCGIVALDHIGALWDKCRPIELYLCDRNVKAAECLAKKIGSDVEIYEDVYNLLNNNTFDIVHVLTPPDSHYVIAKHAIENGANVLIEKPMTLKVWETKDLFQMGETKGRLICVDHSLIYMKCVLKAFDLIKSGKMGNIISAHCFFGHVEKRNTIPYGGLSHWAYRVPGGPLANLVSHPASIIVELLGEPEEVDIITTSRNLMPYGLSDLINVSICSPKGHGSFCVSMAHGSSSRYVNIECERGGIYVDLGRQLMIPRLNKGLLGPISKKFGGFGQGLSFINGTISVMYDVVTRRMKSNPGTRELISRFYNSVRNDLPAPVSKENAIWVAKILEKIVGIFDSRTH